MDHFINANSEALLHLQSVWVSQCDLLGPFYFAVINQICRKKFLFWSQFFSHSASSNLNWWQNIYNEHFKWLHGIKTKQITIPRAVFRIHQRSFSFDHFGIVLAV